MNSFSMVFFLDKSSSRYIDRSYDNEQNDDFYFPSNDYMTRADRSHALERYLRNLLAFDNQNDENNYEVMRVERRGKAITKGDPREFMG